MGKHEDNRELIVDVPDGLAWTGKMHLHNEDNEVDTYSVAFDHDDYDDLKSAAATSQAAFDTAAAAVDSTWYSTLTSGQKAGFRGVFLSL